MVSKPTVAAIAALNVYISFLNLYGKPEKLEIVQGDTKTKRVWYLKRADGTVLQSFDSSPTVTHRMVNECINTLRIVNEKRERSDVRGSRQR